MIMWWNTYWLYYEPTKRVLRYSAYDQRCASIDFYTKFFFFFWQMDAFKMWNTVKQKAKKKREKTIQKQKYTHTQSRVDILSSSQQLTVSEQQNLGDIDLESIFVIIKWM